MENRQVNEIHVRTHFTIGELTEGFRAYLRWSRWRLLSMHAAAAACFLAAAYIQWPQAWPCQPASMVLVGAAVLLLILRSMLAGSFQQSIEGHPYLNQWLQWKLTPAGFALTIEDQLTEGSWSSLQRLVRDRSGFLLFLQKHQFVWLPRAAFANDRELTLFESWLAAATPGRAAPNVASSPTAPTSTDDGMPRD